MCARNVSLTLKPNTLTEFMKTMENEIVPLLRKQKGFQDEITLSVPGGSYSSKYFKVFSEGFMAFWNLKAARLHAACPHGWPRTDKIRLSRRAPMQPALGVAPAASRLPFLPDAGTYRRRAGSRATPKGCICSPKYEEALCHHEGPSGPGATSCRVPKGNRVSPLRCQT